MQDYTIYGHIDPQGNSPATVLARCITAAISKNFTTRFVSMLNGYLANGVFYTNAQVTIKLVVEIPDKAKGQLIVFTRIECPTAKGYSIDYIKTKKTETSKTI